jgi:hypothetical protein
MALELMALELMPLEHRTSRGPSRAAHGSWWVALLALGVATLPAAAGAQTCPSVDTDVFRAARRTRRVIADATALLATHQADQARNAALYRRQTDAPRGVRVALAGLLDRTQTYGFAVCSEQGPWQGDLIPLQLGAVASVELPAAGLGLEGFALLLQDRLAASPTAAQTRGPDGAPREPTGLASIAVDDLVVGGRVTLLDWVSVMGAWVQTRALQNVVGDDGRRLVSDALVTDRSGRLYLGLGVPRYAVTAHVLFATQDVAADKLELAVEQLPLPGLDGPTGAVAVGWLDDERQLTLTLGVRRVFGFLSTEVAIEHRPVALRHARVRADWSTFFGHEPTGRAATPDQVEPRMGVDVGAFAELSWFGSRWLEAQTGSDGEVGTHLGVFVQPDLTLLMTRLELRVGVNEPDALALLSEAAGRWFVGFRLHGRLGL